MSEAQTSEQQIELPAEQMATVSEIAPKKAKPAKPSPAQRKRPARLTREEQIRQQANPSSRLTGKQKTLKLPLQYTSDIMHQYIQLNQSKMLDAYERLAALLRMIVSTPDLHQQVKEWISKNIEISNAQLTELSTKRALIAQSVGDIQIPKIVVPDTYHTEFEASHPIASTMVATLVKVDRELDECEKLYLAGVIDDVEYNLLFNQATGVIRGTVDRIFKATTPGRRKDNGRYSPAQLAAWLREGNKLIFADIPQNLNYIIEDAA